VKKYLPEKIYRPDKQYPEHQKRALELLFYLEHAEKEQHNGK
jgi:hypothetical protein